MEIIFLLMMLFAGWVLFKILKFIFWFLSVLFSPDDNKTTTTHSKPVVKEDESELKYKNAVYISFRDKVHKAFEVLKKEEYPVRWTLDDCGFIVPISGSIFEGSEIYEASVRFDDKNRFTSKDPYYLLLAYGVLFKESDLDYYKKMSEYLNKYIYKELKKPGIFFSLDYVEDTEFKIFYCNLIISNDKNSYTKVQKLSDVDGFKYFFDEAKQAYYEGINLYRFRD